MPDSEDWRQRMITRRNAIRAGIAGGAGLFAGCTDDAGKTSTPENGGTPTDGGTAEGVHDARFVELDRAGTPPRERHFNPWNPTTNGCWFPGQVVFDRLAIYSPAAGKSYGIIANDWKMPDDKTLEVELSDQWTWHNGDKFVADDWVMQFQMEKAISSFQSDEENPTIFESIKAVDDTFIRIKLTTPLSERFAVMKTIAQGQGNIGRGTFTKHDDPKWSSWHETLRTGSQSEKKQTIQEITTTPYPRIMSDQAFGHGAFELKEVGDAKIVMERYEDHPNIDNVNFNEYTYYVPANIGMVFQPFANGVVDATSKGFPVAEDLRSQLPKETELYREALSANKLFCFNCGHGEGVPDSIVSNRHVRRALAHVFDRQKMIPLLQGVNQPFKWPPCRIPGKIMEAGNAPSAKFVKDKFEHYGKGNTERAAEILRGEGFTRNERGNWFTPDGKPFQITILNAAKRPDFQTWIKQLKDFGVLVTQENVDSATFDQRRKSGNYDIIPDGSSANGIFAMWQHSLIVGWVLKTLTHGATTAEIPMPIGDPKGSSGMKEINIPEWITQWMVTGEEKYHRELMWWWNQYLPEFEVMYQPDAGAINTKHWDFKNVPDPIVNGVGDALSISTKLEEGSLKYLP